MSQMEGQCRIRCGEGLRASIFSVHHSPCISTCSRTPNLFKLHPFGVLMETLLHIHDWLKHWPLTTEFHLQRLFPHRRSATENSNLQSHCELHWQPAPILRGPRYFPKVTNLSKKWHPCLSHHLGNFEGFKNSVSWFYFSPIKLFIKKKRILCHGYKLGD